MAHAFAHKLSFHASLVLEEEFLAAVFAEIDAAVLRLEMFRVEYLVADQVQCQRLNQHRAERLDEVERQRPASILRGMEKAQRGVKPVRVNEGHCLGVKQRRAEGNAGIDRIERRASGTALEGEL